VAEVGVVARLDERGQLLLHLLDLGGRDLLLLHGVGEGVGDVLAVLTHESLD
jgi:hypothetical protein